MYLMDHIPVSELVAEEIVVTDDGNRNRIYKLKS